jgi:carboxypeptidase D
LLELFLSWRCQHKTAHTHILKHITLHTPWKKHSAFLPLLAEWLCENNGKDARATRIVRDVHLYIVPTMNPDGFAAGRRENANGFDLNRNFPDRVRDAGHDMTQPLADTQPEAASMMTFLLSKPWLAGANFHEGAMVLNIPYDRYDRGESGTGENDAPDDAVYRYLGRAYTKAHATMATDPKGWPDGITNGAEWYPINGGMQDWDYTTNGGMHVTIETSWQKSPPRTQIVSLWDANRDALLAYALAAMDGARGTVKNAAGDPLAATLKVKNNGTGSAAPIPFKTAPTTGFYARALAPGTTVVLQASAPGYQTAEATVTVPAAGSGGIVQDFVLSPVAGHR